MGNIKVATLQFKAQPYTYKQTQDSVLQNIHCHDVMLSFAKQCTLHSSTFPIGKVSCKLGRHKYLIIDFYGK